MNTETEVKKSRAKRKTDLTHAHYKGPYVVEWIDPVSNYGRGPWRQLAEVKNTKPAMVRSLGYIIAETEDLIVLASHIATHEGDEEVGGDVSIPKANIKKQRELK
jgi:hypothetical protein